MMVNNEQTTTNESQGNIDSPIEITGIPNDVDSKIDLSTNTNNEPKTDQAENEPSSLSCWRRTWKRFIKILNDNAFVLEIISVIVLAYIYPPLGAKYLAPHITASWLAVLFIFGK